MFKKADFFVSLIFIITINTTYAGWERYPYLSGTWDTNIKGKFVGRFLSIPQYGQPTKYTCGATSISMHMVWETHKKGKALKYDPLAIHNYVNEGDKTSGLTTVEMKAGMKKSIAYINRTRNLGLKTIMTERKESTIKKAISTIATIMARNFSPVILYGNVKYASAGGHYLLTTGVYNCPKGICSKDIIGLFINDSAYNSPAYSSSHPVRQLAVSPRKFLSQNELESYWKPTGSRLPWLRGHMYLYNSSSKI